MVKYGSLARIVMVASFFNFCSQLGDNKEKFIDIQLYFSSSYATAFATLVHFLLRLPDLGGAGLGTLY